MDIFCDTNVLVAGLEMDHPHHDRAFPVLKAVASGSDVGFISNHSIAEAYAALTRMPVSPRIHPQDARRLIETSVLPNFRTLEIEREDYRRAVSIVADLGLPGARIYDALIWLSASKSGASRLYTFDVRHLSELAQGVGSPVICAP